MWEKNVKKVKVFGLEYVRVDFEESLCEFVSDVMIVKEFFLKV